ncbi:hypothetical protein GJAV_G00086270 [Gymnothorax javanicus]|nr:hypothetical protein GJAV_G00086270 [Gymnothorax javanicus]
MKALIVLAAVFQVLSADADYSPCNDPLQWHVETAVSEINDRHHHGYKHRLSKVLSHQLIEKERLECELKLELELEETKCHVVNPKPLKECKFRETEETKVKTNCNVTLRLAARKVEVLKALSCNSEPASAEELVATCPDCPTLLNLTDDQGLDSIKQALKKFNQESKDTVIFTVMQVGRLSTQYMMLGQSYFAEFPIVETNCSKGKESEDCSPLCDSKARRGFCSSTVLGDGDVTVDCEIYDAQDETLVKPRTLHIPFLHPFHSHPCGPEAVQADPFLPDFMSLLPSLGQPSSLPHKFPHCPGQLKMAPTIHSICPPPSSSHP